MAKSIKILIKKIQQQKARTILKLVLLIFILLKWKLIVKPYFSMKILVGHFFSDVAVKN
jgi:hypothetical protein